MKHSSPTPTAQALLAESKWLHGLSRSLVVDAASADDLVQDALAAATGYRGPRPTDPRSWASAVLRNLARDRAKARSRRAHREASSARPESCPSEPSSSVEAAERQRVLLDAVLSLEEPYRTVVVMRWFDDLSVRAIARETGRPVETVKKQLQRAHAQLRKKLESKYGGDGAWAVAMLPLAAAKKSGLVSAGALSAAAALAVAVGGTIFALPKGDSGELPAPDTQTALVATGDQADDRSLVLPDQGDGRIPTQPDEATGTESASHGPSTEVPVVAPEDPGPPSPHFRGRLFDINGTPITSKSAPGLRLRLTPRADTKGAPTFAGPIILTPDAEGRVASEALPNAVTKVAKVAVDGDGLAVIAIGWTGSIEGEAQVVLIPSATLGGTVVDPEGNPVPGANVNLIAELRALGSYPRPIEDFQYSMRYSGQWNTTTNANGRFLLKDVPAGDKFVIQASTVQGASGEIRARSTETLDLVIRVQDWRGTMTTVTGRVMDDRGFPVPGETVHLASETAVTGDDGRFELPVGAKEWDFMHRQSHACLWLRSKAGPFAKVDLDPESRGPYVLRVPTKMGSIRGVLKDASGKPVFRAEVCLFDGTRTPNHSAPLERLDPRNGSGPCLTDRDGSFEIGNLLDRDYTLRFIGNDNALVLDVPAVRPNEPKRDFVIPDGHFHRDFSGRCVDLMGRPLAGLRVSLRAAMQEPSDLPTSWGTTGVTTTDDRGEFTFERVSRKGLTLSFDPDLQNVSLGQSLDIEDVDATGSTPIELNLDCTVHVAQAATSPIASVCFLDAERKKVVLCELRSSSYYHSRSMRPTEDGTYFPCIVPQSSRWIQSLDADGNVLNETELDLFPMTVNEVTL